MRAPLWLQLHIPNGFRILHLWLFIFFSFLPLSNQFLVPFPSKTGNPSHSPSCLDAGVLEVFRTFLSRGNPTEVLKWWGKLNSTTRSFVEAAGFKYFVETQLSEMAQILHCALVERWWDTTHTFHIAGVEMTITPCDVYRLTGLRVDGITPTLSAFPARVRLDWEYLGISLGATSAELPTLMCAFAEAPQSTVEESTWMAWAFLFLPSFLMRHPMRSSSCSKRASLCWIDWMRIVTSRSTSSYSCLLCFLLMWLLLMSPLQVELFQLTPPADIILPSWSVPLYQADGSLHEMAITRHTNVLGYPVPEDTRALCGNMKTMMTDLSRDHFSRPPGSSSRGAQADLEATEFDSDEDGVKLNLPLLQTASDFWDHTRHVFSFNRCELCPIMEEFGAIMGISNFNQMLLPPKHADPILLLDEVLIMPYKPGSSWSMNDGFDLHALVDHFFEVVDEECYPEALAIVVLAGFFLTGDFETDAVALDAISCMDKKNPVLMILGETLNGLDELKESMCLYFKGSPLLL
uniref:Aminotransferase-like plant mobile domain-containing protein n=1 Tax=Fagus sylvatica TaxID=28930 RepID=A0A2N9GUC3_FAGSY